MEGKGGVKKPSTLSPVAKCLWGNRAAIVGEKGKRPAGRSRRGRNRLIGRARAKEKRRTEENRSICLIADCGWDIPFSWVAVWDAAAADEKERKFVKLPSMIHYELMYGSCSIFGSDPLIYAIGGKECTRECPVWENLKRVVCFNARSRCEGWQKSPSLNVPRFDPLILSTHDGTVYAMGSALPGLSFC
ncbi:hypothetical protein L1049_008478 [Liquidambar formosana]|uniref:Uncharacterized protein n=1 Tax=Liquidambar formosana TaxID=63359 RepID=A0AAP0S9W2_LIQFO